jgi:uncharacterized protein (TIGR03067 family)
LAAARLPLSFGLKQSPFKEGNMPAYLVVGAVVGAVLAIQAGTHRGNPEETEADQIARLIIQLGDAAYPKREEASKELQAVGRPALAELRKAAGSSRDAEIRWRAECVVAQVTAAIAKAELGKLQGVWAVKSYEVEGKRLPGKDKRSTMTITGDQWVAKWAKEGGGEQVESGSLKIVNPEKSPLAVDFVHLDGPHKGSTVFAIGRVEGATFQFCYRDRAEDRPTRFVTITGDTRCGLVTFNHQRK